jgi:hypothetical protein
MSQFGWQWLALQAGVIFPELQIYVAVNLSQGL